MELRLYYAILIKEVIRAFSICWGKIDLSNVEWALIINLYLSSLMFDRHFSGLFCSLKVQENLWLFSSFLKDHMSNSSRSGYLKWASLLPLYDIIYITLSLLPNVNSHQDSGSCLFPFPLESPYITFLIYFF